MKIRFRTVLVAVSSLTLLAIGAQAGTLTVATDNDVILGFFAPSTGKNLEVDLGNISQFTSAAAGSTLTLGELSPLDLSGNYGASWQTLSDLTFGVIATTGRPSAGGNYTIWASEPDTTPPNSPYPVKASGPNALSISDIEPVNIRLNGQTSTANSAFSAVIPFSNTGDGSYWGQDTFTAGVSFRQFSPMIDNNISTSFTANSGIAISDFLQLTPGSGNAFGVDIGKFELFSNGALEFVATPVPEPSSIGLMGVGFLSLIGMVVLRRRRSAVA